MRKCSVEGCDRKYAAKGLCASHYMRMYKGREVGTADLTRDRRGPKNSKWRGGIVNDGHGRILIYCPDHPHPNQFGTHVYRYRLEMEKFLGRYLLPEEVVHHKNGIVDDDRIENLEVMTQSNHLKLHSPLTPPLVLQGKWSVAGFNACVICGSSETPHQAKGMCKKCYNVEYQKGKHL